MIPYPLAPNLPLAYIATPAYVFDEAAQEKNLQLLSHVKTESGCKILMALKAFSNSTVLNHIANYLDGTTCSGIFEAKLGHKHFGKETHVYSPAFDDAEIEALVPIASHLTFNSIGQWQRYADKTKHMSVGLRINPELSLAGTDLYNPCAPCSRLGIKKADLPADLSGIEGLHFHILCENLHEDSVALIETVARDYADLLPAMKWVNFGGGHFMTHKNYNTTKLIQAINSFKQSFDIEVFFEPGGAVVLNAGYLVSSVLDIVENGGKKIALIDASATAHMPDVLEMPYRPNIIGAGEAVEKKYSYQLAGRTCLAGDIIADYSFDQPLHIGDKLVFLDMAQYSFVKNTTFNGIPLPDLGILKKDGSYEVLKRYGYEDFAQRVG